MANKESAIENNVSALGAYVSREELLLFLSAVIKREHEKVISGRIRDKAAFKLRQDSIRVFSYLAATYGAILRDTDLDSISKRLEVLENAKQ